MSASIIESLCKNDIFIVPIPPQDGKPTKAPVVSGWNKPRSAINPSGYTNNFSDVSGLRGHNFGIYHAASNTVAFDIDDLAATVALFGEVGLPIEDWLFGDDRLQIVSPRQNRAKLLFRLPEQVESVRLHQYCVPGTKYVMFELRCGNCQDVIVGKHPDGGSYSLVGDVSRIPSIPDALLDMLLHWDVWVSCFNPPVSDPEPINGTKKSVSGAVDPRASFNDLYSLDAVLLRNGYQRRGKRYLRPGSSTSVPGVRVYHDPDGITRCSSAGGDVLNDGHTHDSFSCYCLLECGGDFKVALAWNPDITTENQKAFVASRPGRVVHPAYSEDVPISAYEFDANSTYGYIYDHDGDRPGFKYDPVEYEAIKSVERKVVRRDPVDFDLFNFVLSEERIEEYNNVKNDEVFVLGRMARLGQSTIFFAQSNAGKTLITVHLLIESAKSGILDGLRVIYVNADDDQEGVAIKAKLLGQYGIGMIVPGENDFNEYQFMAMMQKQIDAGKAEGLVVILDTMKKFTDVMDKTASTAFFKAVRRFTMAGATLIMLAHTNKNPGANGKQVMGGVSDSQADCDQTFMVTVASDSLNGRKNVFFERDKKRSIQGSQEEAYSYLEAPKNYIELVETVIRLDKQDFVDVKKSTFLADTFAKDQDEIEAITLAIQSGINTKTELVAHVRIATGRSKPFIVKILDKLTGNNYTTGKRWRTECGGGAIKKYVLLSSETTNSDFYRRKNSFKEE